MKDSEIKENIATVVTSIPPLNVFIIKDNGSYMAKCPELDLVTEMDSKEEALKAIVEMMMEYAEDYKDRENIYLRSPNRAHHKSYIDKIASCKNEWEKVEGGCYEFGSSGKKG